MGQGTATHMFALWTKHHITTKHSLYHLLFGREASYPSQIPMEYEITEQKVEGLISQEALSTGLREQDKTYREVSANILKSQEKVRQRKQQRGEKDHFKVGDLVLLKNVRQEQRKGGKMEADMLGPLLIVNMEGKSADLVSEKGKTKLKENIDHLKRYFLPQERIFSKLKVVQPPALASSACPPVHPPDLAFSFNAPAQPPALASSSSPSPPALASSSPSAQPPALASSSPSAQPPALASSSSPEDSNQCLPCNSGKGERGLNLRLLPHDFSMAENSERAFVRKQCLAIGKWEYSTIPHTRQQDGTSCGILVCTKLQSEANFSFDPDSQLGTPPQLEDRTDISFCAVPFCLGSWSDIVFAFVDYLTSVDPVWSVFGTRHEDKLPTCLPVPVCLPGKDTYLLPPGEPANLLLGNTYLIDSPSCCAPFFTPSWFLFILASPVHCK
ncbi:uncharacterized protein LOC108247144 [Kryptolebias marmoratus]|uniref:uncharacterized protein LOC108247144 n=1 Tax=Kryptolebias marmoratus TaxID=37003 RepID=UPI0018AC9F78|nr:uncharacterized protein LOC108247144 [Kryptolebias marmoratus]